MDDEHEPRRQAHSRSLRKSSRRGATEPPRGQIKVSVKRRMAHMAMFRYSSTCRSKHSVVRRQSAEAELVVRRADVDGRR